MLFSDAPSGKGVPMPGETELHKTLKKEGCRWLYRMGYRCIAAEVRLRPLGIIDAVGTGVFRAFHNYLFLPRELPQVCFIECKASRAECLMQPLANLHYVLAPGGIIQKKDLPPRWGLLSYGPAGITVVVRADWQETSRPDYVESAIARTLTGDIYRADDRAIQSVNREIFSQQTMLAEKIRASKPQAVFAPGRLNVETI
jgi:hypothetical protein